MEEEKRVTMLVLLLSLTASVLVLVKLFLPRLLSTALHSGMGLKVVRSHFRLLHMKFLRVEMDSGRGWGATVDEVALKVNSNFGSREGIFLLTLQGVRLRRDPGETTGFDPGGGGGVPKRKRRELGRVVDSILAKIVRVVEKFFLNKVAAAVALEVRQAEFWAGEASSVLTAAVISLSKVPGADRVRMRCVDARLRPRTWREDESMLLRSLRCPVLEVDFSGEGVASDKVSVSAEAGGTLMEWSGAGEYELGLSGFRLARKDDDGPWLAEASDVCLAKEGVFSLDFGSVVFMQADSGKVLSQLSKLRLNAKRRGGVVLHASSSMTGPRFSVSMESIAILVEDDSDDLGRLRVGNVQMDKLAVVKKDVLATEGEKPIFGLSKLCYNLDPNRNASTEVVEVRADLTCLDIAALSHLRDRIRKARSGGANKARAVAAQANTVSVRVQDISGRLQVGEKHRLVMCLKCEGAFAESKWQARQQRRSKVVLSDCALRTEVPKDMDILEKIDAMKVILLHASAEGDKGASVQVVLRSPARLHWNPDLHLSLWESAQQMLADRREEQASSPSSSPPHSFSLLVSELSTSFHCDCTVASLRFTEAVLFLAPASNECYLKATTLQAGLEGPVATAKEVLLVHLFMASYSGVTSEMRAGAGVRWLQKESNPCLSLSADSCSLFVPFQVDLHRALLVDVAGYFKWLKQIHLGDRRRSRRGEEARTCLPDMALYVRRLVCKVEDDEFEVRLRENYRLMEDEFQESQKRRECLQRKIEELRQSHSSFLSSAKVEELYSTLKKRDAELYTKRARGLKAKPREAVEALVSVTVSNVKLFLLSDLSLESMDSAVSFMQVSLVPVQNG